jgi:hypothetical protein
MLASNFQSILSGDALTAHAGVASAFGAAAATILAWGLTLIHLDPPSNVEVAMAVILTFGASWAMKKFSG